MTDSMKREDRALTLLRATLDILRKSEEGPHVRSALELTAHYDGAECDGRCLMDDIEHYLEYDAPALAALQPSGEMGWQPIETAPKKGRILVATEKWVCETENYQPDLWLNVPTHWMPLPPAPLPSSKREG